MNKRFGPFVVNAGTHIEDHSVGRTVRIKVHGPGSITVTENGKELPVEVGREGAQLVIGGKHFAMYIGDRKVTLGATRPDVDVTLAEQRTFGSPLIPEGRRLPQIRYEPFMSYKPLTEKGSRTAAGGKYSFHREQVDAGTMDELERLRKRNAELEAAVLERDADGNKPTQSAQPAQDDKRQQLPRGGTGTEGKRQHQTA